jgi:hypothetical protein
MNKNTCPSNDRNVKQNLSTSSGPDHGPPGNSRFIPAFSGIFPHFFRLFYGSFRIGYIDFEEVIQFFRFEAEKCVIGVFFNAFLD